MDTKPIGPNKVDLEAVKQPQDAKGKTTEPTFEKLLDETIGKVAGLQKEADRAIEELASGSGDIVQAMVAIQKAELSFQTMVEVRNKLLSAYEELMRMQI
ncbi:MAG: flagellar hook-basal body complex protein FliE [Nitrospirae bacterium]|nr:MAG: flagellar hook-basal body complex protein FliE [Nitrospirota bacterium]